MSRKTAALQRQKGLVYRYVITCDRHRTKRKMTYSFCAQINVSDLWTLEKVGFYRGLYNVLGGSLSAIQGIGTDELKIEHLLKRIETNNVKEIILALSTTMEGQTTSFVIADKLEKFKDLNVTRLAQGIPMGGEVHYLDENTLNTAFQSRKKIT